MDTLLIKNAAVVVTMDDNRREITDGGLLVRDNVIEQVGKSDDLPYEADRVLDLSDHVILPGLINTHHHMYQTLTRVLAQDSNLFNWLKTLYPIWANLTDEGVYTSTLTALAELALSGCTTSSDHLYIFPNDCTLDSQIRAAQEIGVRFHAARGSMSLGESQGGLPPDSVTEDEETILKDSQRLIEQYHDHDRHAMLRIVIAPCSPFSVTEDLMRQSAEMARHYDVHLHTHLAETFEEEEFCLETYGKRPVWYVESLGWVGDDVWHAHCIHLSPSEIKLLGHTKTGVAHCPSSNMRLGSGIAPVSELLQNGVNVGLGVDGSASNDGAHLLAEARQAMLLQRVNPVAHHPSLYERATEMGSRLGPMPADVKAMSARQALELATRGGAAVLGRDDIGVLAPGMSADFVAYDVTGIPFAGAQSDLVSAVLFCHPQNVDLSVINGRIVVEDGRLTTVDMEKHLIRHNQISQAMIRGE
jgi:cytosine/adenosine deaminase-related metal-dependent hydrolase